MRGRPDEVDAALGRRSVGVADRVDGDGGDAVAQVLVRGEEHVVLRAGDPGTEHGDRPAAGRLGPGRGRPGSSSTNPTPAPDRRSTGAGAARPAGDRAVGRGSTAVRGRTRRRPCRRWPTPASCRRPSARRAHRAPPTARSLNRRGRAMSVAGVDPALCRRSTRSSPRWPAADAGGGVGLPAVELAHHLTELAGGGHRGEGRPARLAVHAGGDDDLVAGGLPELRRRAGRTASSRPRPAGRGRCARPIDVSPTRCRYTVDR